MWIQVKEIVHCLLGVDNMKIKLAVLVFTTLFCFSYAATQASGQSGPKIVAPQRQHDFGTVYQGTELKWDFEITNQGDAPLVIQKVPSS
jgi:hypothetical protein